MQVRKVSPCLRRVVLAITMTAKLVASYTRRLSPGARMESVVKNNFAALGSDGIGKALYFFTVRAFRVRKDITKHYIARSILCKRSVHNYLDGSQRTYLDHTGHDHTSPLPCRSRKCFPGQTCFPAAQAQRNRRMDIPYLQAVRCRRSQLCAVLVLYTSP